MPTVKLEPVKEPDAVTVHPIRIATLAGLNVQAAAASAGANPLPLTVTVIPAGPEFGVSVIVGDAVETTNVAWPKSPELPVTVMV